MVESPKIPLVSNPSSALSRGLNAGNLAIGAAERHPVDVLQRLGGAPHSILNNPYQDLEFVRSVYGSGLAMEMAAERQMARRETAMGMTKIGSLTHDVYTGQDATLQFGDFMSLPENRVELPTSAFHVTMERHLRNF
jgi:Proteasome maturation factor UMP1